MNHALPLAPLAATLRAGETDIQPFYDSVKARIAEIDPTIQAFVESTVDWSSLDVGITALRNEFPEPATRPPLFGIPVGIKDIIHVSGMQTRAGSRIAPDVLTGTEAPVVSRLKAAGGIVLGKTHTTEFAYRVPAPTKNPHNPSHTPGGSSSGSAAAVAAGLCPLAVGTQTVGSVIRPAAYCGIVGYKPTYGRIPIGGVIPFAPSVDHIGLFTQDTRGMELAASQVCDDWQHIPDPETDPRLGVPDGPYLEQASEIGQRAFENHLDTLRTAGYDVTRVSVFDDIATINERHNQLIAAEAALVHESWFQSHKDQYADPTVELIEHGRSVSAGAIASARESRRIVRQSVDTARRNAGIDLWIAPAAPGPAPAGLDSTGDPVMNLPWTHTGLPTLTLPASVTDDGLPLGLQVIGVHNSDELLLKWSHSLSSRLNNSS